MPLFDSSRLRLARELRGLSVTDLASRIGVSPGAVSHYETGRVRQMTQEVLARLASILDFPPRFFTDREEVTWIDTESCRYRGRSRIPMKQRRYVESRAVLFHELMDSMEGHLKLPHPDIPTLECSPEEAAKECRRAWGLADGPIPNVIDLLELHGIWILLLEGDFSKEVDAFSYWFNGRAVIVLNPAKCDAYRSRFDAAHELGHLVMHVDAAGGGSKQVRELEAEANQFASAFLMPAASWVREAPRSINPWEYLSLKRKWKVSAAAMIRRSKDTGLITQQQYEAAVVRYSRLGWRMAEPDMEGVEREHPRVMNLCLLSLGKAGISHESIANALHLHLDNLRVILGNEYAPVPVSRPPGGSKRIVKLAQWKASDKRRGT